MNYLLDTCTFLWIIASHSRLSVTATRRFTDPANTIFMSAVSAWEIGVLHGRGKVVLPQPPTQFVPAQRVAHGINSLELTEDVALLVEGLPSIHRDPFDRMLICQAIAHGLVILTPDPEIRKYPIVRTEW
jgi:PIN domain nuclease of toxin-antitoxin system